MGISVAKEECVWKEGRRGKEGEEGDWMKSFSVTFSTILLQSVIGRHIDTSVHRCNRKCMWCGYQFRCELGIGDRAYRDCSCRCVSCCVDGSEEEWGVWEPPSVIRISISTLLRECIFTKNMKYFASRVSARLRFLVSLFPNPFPALSNSSLSLFAYFAKA